jgi:hypothetical protein
MNEYHEISKNAQNVTYESTFLKPSIYQEMDLSCSQRSQYNLQLSNCKIDQGRDIPSNLNKKICLDYPQYFNLGKDSENFDILRSRYSADEQIDQTRDDLYFSELGFPRDEIDSDRTISTLEECSSYNEHQILSQDFRVQETLSGQGSLQSNAQLNKFVDQDDSDSDEEEKTKMQIINRKQDIIINDMLSNRSVSDHSDHEKERQRRMYNMLRHSKHYKKRQVFIFKLD